MSEETDTGPDFWDFAAAVLWVSLILMLIGYCVREVIVRWPAL